jgi:hypothetical protein
MSNAWWRPSPAVFRAANRVVRPILSSPLHPVLSRWLMLITYTGARTGREYAVPVAYYRWAPDEVWAFAARTGWMSNLRDGRTVRVRIHGCELPARPAVVEDRESVAHLLQELVRRKGPEGIKDPLLGLPRDREPTLSEALAAAARTRIARLRLLPASR